MKKNLEKQFKESFINVQFIVIFIGTVLSIIFYFVANLDFLLIFFFLGLFLIVFYVIGFCKCVKMRNHADDIRNGNLKYKPYIIDKESFIFECKNGLIYSLIRINNVIYEIETQLDVINSTNYDRFICYVDENEIKGIDNFLNYKFDGVHSFNDLDTIEFLEYNNNDPKRYFVDKIID